MALSVRTRFEVFKRDEFRCRYCGRQSPEVVLEVDHIVPVCDGGSDDPINLATSCWDCNHGKAGVPLDQVVTGEDPHEKAILLLERERQLREYNTVLAVTRARAEADTWELWRYWQIENGHTDEAAFNYAPRQDLNWLRSAVAYCPKELIRNFMDLAQLRRATDNLRYVGGCVRSWREAGKAEAEQPRQPRTLASEGYSYSESMDIEADIRDYVRSVAIEQVLLELREAEYRRRAVGHCTHETTCASFQDCVQRQVRIKLGVEN
jgi:hypothetical protein